MPFSGDSDRRPGARLLIAALAIAAAAVLWMRLDFSALPEVTRFRDDAYYFFVWARNLAAGDGPCVTPGVPTSGVHLLWAVLLAGGAAAGLGPDVLPQFAHVLGLILHLVTALSIAWLFRAQGGAAIAGALLYLGNPMVVTESQNGQETALACTAAVWLVASAMRRGPWFAVTAVLATLARSDLFLLVPFLAWYREGVSWRALRVPALALMFHGAACWILAGDPLQDSATPIPWLFAEREPDWWQQPGRFWWWFRPCLLGGPYGLVGAATVSVLVAVAVRPWLRGWMRWLPLALTGSGWLVGAEDLAVPFLASVWIAVSAERSLDRPPAPLLALLAGWVAIVVVHHVVRLYPRPYYFAPMAVAGVVAVIVLLSRQRLLGTVVLLAAAAAQVWQARGEPEQRPWQEEMSMAGRFLSEVVEVDGPVGCFNAGLVTALHSGPVINLDGVVNRPAFDALRRKGIDDYLDAQGVRLLVDVPAQFARHAEWPHASGKYFGGDFDPAVDLREIARFDVPEVDAGVPGTDAVCLYWRVGRGQPPAVRGDTRVVGESTGRGRYVLWTGSAARLMVQPPDAGRRLLAVRKKGEAIVVMVPTPAPGRYILSEGADVPSLLVLDVR